MPLALKLHLERKHLSHNYQFLYLHFNSDIYHCFTFIKTTKHAMNDLVMKKNQILISKLNEQ